MTDYSKSVIIVNADTRSVSVDGRTLVCLTEVPRGLRTMRWDASVTNWPGFAEDATGEGRAFKEYDRVAPYVSLWEAAVALDDENKAAAAAHASAAETRRKAEEDAAKAEHEASVAAQLRAIASEKPVNDALSNLAASDYRIIKAVEELLVKSGELDPTVAAEREAWRNVVRAKREAH